MSKSWVASSLIWKTESDIILIITDSSLSLKSEVSKNYASSGKKFKRASFTLHILSVANSES